MKVCFKCRTAKPRAEFYSHAMMGDGLLGKCKDCAKRDAKTARLARIGHYRQYDRKRASAPHRKALAARVQMEYRQTKPHARRAQAKLRAALLAGKISRLPCFICGERSEAHHPDYSMPLDVVWLCPPHHKQAHAME